MLYDDDDDIDRVRLFVSELQPPTGLLLFLEVIYMSMENHSGMKSTEKHF
jgi:hypothetical protein